MLLAWFFFLFFFSKWRFRATFFPMFLIFCLCVCVYCMYTYLLLLWLLLPLPLLLFSFFILHLLHHFVCRPFYLSLSRSFSYCRLAWVFINLGAAYFVCYSFFRRCRCLLLLSGRISRWRKNLLPNFFRRFSTYDSCLSIFFYLYLFFSTFNLTATRSTYSVFFPVCAFLCNSVCTIFYKPPQTK